MTSSIKDNKKTSKFLSLVLRHDPAKIGLTLDDQGWANIAELLEKAPIHLGLSRDVLDDVVANNEKKRFRISADGTRIRASQGHSVRIDLNLKPAVPPDVLYHGTATRFLESIMEEGLKPGARNHVHLSLDLETANRVGQRHGKPVVLIVDAKRMAADGFEFFLSDNTVWLTVRVPANYLVIAPDRDGR